MARSRLCSICGAIWLCFYQYLIVVVNRKETVNPDAPLPPLPLHLHPPTLTKRPSIDMQKDKEKESKDKERLLLNFF